MRDALAAVAPWLQDADAAPARPLVAAAVRLSARYLAAEHPGGAVEVRIPPYVAVQCIEGLTHKRGTPPNVIETDPRTWLLLATGVLGWGSAVADALVTTSGQRADLSAILPLAL
ncbi:hypothetical protein CLV47_105173 [Antricoccus suffuscus]|uniref:Bacterial SCP orthologue domain-containing protein n=1 Tax=Antricoccus suffuscus TaxID=1629062 RepID=A0A2T1A1R1_9ACTN|nr:sterol carrier family protein [Antricoccus suffuscus]PRZ42551.1 hypothetical protein CLV47_105173 [Antricoccus suffuscus]